eukprot:2608845-Pyramimonas_sp.AAC.1
MASLTTQRPSSPLRAPFQPFARGGAARAGAPTTRGRRLYTMGELDDVLASFKVTSSALRGCYAS